MQSSVVNAMVYITYGVYVISGETFFHRQKKNMNNVANEQH